MYEEKERGNLQNESIWICKHAHPAYHNWRVIQAHLHKMFRFAFLRYNWASTLHYNELQINANEDFIIKQYKTVIAVQFYNIKLLSQYKARAGH